MLQYRPSITGNHIKIGPTADTKPCTSYFAIFTPGFLLIPGKTRQEGNKKEEKDKTFSKKPGNLPYEDEKNQERSVVLVPGTYHSSFGEKTPQ